MYAPKFVPKARAKTDPSRTFGSTEIEEEAEESSHDWRTRARRIVVPMFVPQIFIRREEG